MQRSTTTLGRVLRIRWRVSGVLFVLFVLVVIAVAGNAHGAVDPPGGPNTVVRVDAATGSVEAVVDVGEDPLLLVVSSGRVWVLNVADGTVSMVDPDSNTERRIALREAVGITGEGDGVWVAYGGNRLARLNGRSGAVESTLRVGSSRLFALRDSGALAFARGSLWLTVPVLGQNERVQRLFRIDPHSGRVTARIPINKDPAAPLVAGRYLWLLDRVDYTVMRVDTATLRSRSTPVGTLPFGAAAGAGSIWIAHDFERAVWRLDPQSLGVQARIALGERVRGVAFGRGLVWVTTETSLRGIDPRTNRVVQRVVLSVKRHSDGPIGVGVLGSSLWVSVE